VEIGVVTPPPEENLRDIRSWLRPATVEHVITGLIAVLGAFWAMRWNLSDLDQPLRVGEGDLSSIYALADVFRAPFIYSSAEYGYPFSANFAVQVVPDDATNTLIGLLKWASGSPIIAVNSFILLSFGLTSSAMLSLLRHYIEGPVLRVIFALSTAWMPYVFVRIGYGHVLLSAIWPIPLTIGIILTTIEKQTATLEDVIKRFILALLVGSSSAYYGFFSALILSILLTGFLFSHPIGSLDKRQTLKRFSIAAGFLTPVAIRVFSMRWMGLEQPINRAVDESLQFGGRLIDVFVPIDLPFNLPIELTSHPEVEWSPIHTLGAVGVWMTFIFVRRGSKRESHLKAIIIISTIFFASGGLGYVFAVLATPSFRAWSRLLPIIAVASLTLLAISMQRLLKRGRRRSSALLLLALTIPLGMQLRTTEQHLSSVLQDRAPDNLLGPYLSGSTATATLKPPKCPVLQTPVMRAFEGGDVGPVRNGDHYWPGIVSSSSTWTYGAIKGTIAGEFLPLMSELWAEELFRWYSQSDVCGVWADTRASQVDLLSNPKIWIEKGLSVTGQFGGHVVLSK